MSVKDKDYFGLRFVDSTRQRVSVITLDLCVVCILNIDFNSHQLIHFKYWLDLSKPILKQVKGTFALILYAIIQFEENFNLLFFLLLYRC